MNNIPKIFGLTPHIHQIEAFNALISGGFGPKAVSLPTGSGKTFLIALILNHFDMKSLVLVPSVAIGKQLVKVFSEYFGKNRVGLVGDNKKEYNKQIVVALGQTLTRLKPDTKEWDLIAKSNVLVSDESHLDAPESFERVCMGVCKDIPYRFFTSATQMRNDGSDLKLKGIIGDVVYDKNFKELVQAKAIAEPTFMITKSKSNSNYMSKNELAMMRKHWINNSDLHEQAAKLANRLVNECGQRVLILLDEVNQFKYLYNHLRSDFRFSHGPLNTKNKQSIPKEYHDCDIDLQVKGFNSGEFPILIGTSVLGTGVDIKVANTVINLQGGGSKVKFTQSVGRGARLAPNKDKFNFVDFDVVNIPILHNQFLKRLKVYKGLYDQVVSFIS